MKKNHLDLCRGWLLKAESDLADARRTLNSEGPYDTACFHCQQAAEKYLKAFLAWHKKEIPRTHDIEELLIICKNVDPTFSPQNLVPEQLTSYAVEMRYDAEFWPDKAVGQGALVQVEKIRNEVKERIPPRPFDR